MQFGARNAPLFALFSALSILGMCRDRTFNAVVAGSSPARLTILSDNSVFQNASGLLWLNPSRLSCSQAEVFCDGQ